jgi:hypothetical protein
VAMAVSDCKGCHTYRNPNTGAYEGQTLAGGPVGHLTMIRHKMLVAPT